MTKTTKWTAVVTALLMCVAVAPLAACNDSTPVAVAQPAPVVQQVPAQPPVYVQAAPMPLVQVVPQPVYVHHDNSLLTGMLIGHALSGGYSHRTYVTHTNVIRRSYAPSYSRSYSYRRR